MCGTKASELCCRLNLTQPDSKADGVRGPGGAVALSHSVDAIGASHFPMDDTEKRLLHGSMTFTLTC